MPDGEDAIVVLHARIDPQGGMALHRNSKQMPSRVTGAIRSFTIISFVLSAIAAGCSSKADLTLPGEENPTPEGGIEASAKADGSQGVIQVGDSSARDRSNGQSTPDGCVAV